MSTISFISIDDEGGRWTARAFDHGGTVVETAQAPLDAAPPLQATGVTRLWAATGPDAPAPRALPAKPLSVTQGHISALTQANPPERIHPVEAARIAGLLAAQPNFDGVIWLAGPTSLWAHVSAEEIVSVTRAASYATLGGLGIVPTDGAAFSESCATCLSRPERMLRMLANAAQGFEGADAASGAILGAELAAARPWWLGQRVIVLDHPQAPGWATLCAAALEAQGVLVTLGSGEAALHAGLARASAL